MMVREKRDRPDDDAVEIGAHGSEPNGDTGAEQEDRASDERPGGESLAASSDPPADAENVDDVAPQTERDDPQTIEPSATAETSGIDNLGEAPSEIEGIVQLPPPPAELLPPPSIVSSFLTPPPDEAGGISFGDFSLDASAPGEGLAIQDLVDRASGSASSDVEQAILHTSPAAPPPASVPDGSVDSPIDGQQDSPSTARISPLFLSMGSGERRVVKKRLEIEVEITVTNQQRISTIAVDKSKDELKLFAGDAVYKVKKDLRTFRESYRDAWGRW